VLIQSHGTDARAVSDERVGEHARDARASGNLDERWPTRKGRIVQSWGEYASIRRERVTARTLTRGELNLLQHPDIGARGAQRTRALADHQRDTRT
jgi:hypothetical protein